MKTATVAELQAALKANPETADIEVLDDDTKSDEPRQPNYLGQLAEQMVRDREGGISEPCGPDPWVGLRLDVEPGAAFGLVQAQIKTWLDERDRWASEIEIRRKADELIADAEQRRPVSTTATYTVNPDGTVGDYVINQAERELPGMPGHPEAPAADPVEPSMLWDPAVWGKVVNPGTKATMLWEIPQNREFTNGQLKRAVDLDDMVDVLVRTVRPLTTLAPLTIGWYWKLKGGRSRGKPVLSRVAVADKTLAYERQYDVIVHLSADHLRKMKASALFVERLVFDALARIDPAGPRVAPADEWAVLPGRWRYGWLGPDERLYATLVAQIDSGHQDDTTVDLDATAAPQVATQAELNEAIDAFNRGDDEIDEDWDGPSDDAPHAQDALVCSVCGKPVEAAEIDNGEVYQELDLDDAVVLCEACGEDGIQDDDGDDGLRI